MLDNVSSSIEARISESCNRIEIELNLQTPVYNNLRHAQLIPCCTEQNSGHKTGEAL